MQTVRKYEIYHNKTIYLITNTIFSLDYIFSDYLSVKISFSFIYLSDTYGDAK